MEYENYKQQHPVDSYFQMFSNMSPSWNYSKRTNPIIISSPSPSIFFILFFHCEFEVKSAKGSNFVRILQFLTYFYFVCYSAEIIERGHQQFTAYDVSPSSRWQYKTLQRWNDCQAAWEFLQGSHLQRQTSSRWWKGKLSIYLDNQNNHRECDFSLSKKKSSFIFFYWSACRNC